MAHLYLDNHTITRPSKRAIEAMLPFLHERWGAVAAPHMMGEALRPVVEESYRSIHNLLGSRETDTLVFTSSGAEAINQVVMSIYYDIEGKNHYLTTTTDEAAVIMAYERIAGFGCEIDFFDPEKLADKITPRTALVSMQWANGLTGVIHPVEEIAELCRDRGILLHLDASHVLGKIAFDLDAIAPDFISFSGDLIHAPAGTGALWIRSGLKPSPLIVGANDQEGLRAGPLPIALLRALSVACEEALDARDQMETARLRSKLEEGLNGTVLFADKERLPNTTCIAFPNTTADLLLYRLQRKGVFASFGGGSAQQLALQLQACGIDKRTSHTAISLSLSRETTEEEIDQAIEVINETVRLA